MTASISAASAGSIEAGGSVGPPGVSVGASDDPGVSVGEPLGWSVGGAALALGVG